jgi:hypothetical protein
LADKDDDILKIGGGSGSGSSDKIELFGVKLDLYQTIIGIIAGGAALGTGYLLYNDMQKQSSLEQVKKQQDNTRELQYLAYLREQEAARRNQLMHQNPPPSQQRPQQPQQQEDDVEEPRLDMNYYKPTNVPESRRLSYNEILNQSELSNPNNPYGYNISSPMNDYNATFPSRNAPPPPPPPQQNRPLINMSNMISNPNMEVSGPPHPPHNPRQPLSQHQPNNDAEATEQASQDEIDDLYKSMNNY